jgi:hypothetical protein
MIGFKRFGLGGVAVLVMTGAMWAQVRCANADPGDAAPVADEAEAKDFTVKVDAPKTVKAGAQGKLVLKIQPDADRKIDPRAPLKIQLAGSRVELDKKELKAADADEKESKAPSFTVAFTAGKEPGAGEIKADLSFFICTKESCMKRKDTVTVAVSVE